MEEIKQTIERIIATQDRMINHMDAMIEKMDNMIHAINETKKQEAPKKGRNSFKKQWIKWAQ